MDSQPQPPLPLLVGIGFGLFLGRGFILGDKNASVSCKASDDAGSASEVIPDDFEDLFTLRLWRFPLSAGSLLLGLLLVKALYPGRQPWIVQEAGVTYQVIWLGTARTLHSKAVFGLGLLGLIFWLYWIRSTRSWFSIGTLLLVFLPFWGVCSMGPMYDTSLVTIPYSSGFPSTKPLIQLPDGSYAVVGEVKEDRYQQRTALIAREPPGAAARAPRPRMVMPKHLTDNWAGYYGIRESDYVFIEFGRARFFYREGTGTMVTGRALCDLSPFALLSETDEVDLSLKENGWLKSPPDDICDPMERLAKGLDHPNALVRALVAKVVSRGPGDHASPGTSPSG